LLWNRASNIQVPGLLHIVSQLMQHWFDCIPGQSPTCDEISVLVILSTINGIVHLSYQNQSHGNRDTSPIVLRDAYLESRAIILVRYIRANNLSSTAVLQQYTRCTIVKCPLFVNGTNVSCRIRSEVFESEGKIIIGIEGPHDAWGGCI